MRKLLRPAYLKWFETTDPVILRRLNNQRRAKKMPVIRNPTTLKKPMSGFLAYVSLHYSLNGLSLTCMCRFCQERYMPGAPIVEMAKVHGTAWRALSAAEKDVRPLSMCPPVADFFSPGVQ
jgi:hypothetical protein